MILSLPATKHVTNGAAAAATALWLDDGQETPLAIYFTVQYIPGM